VIEICFDHKLNTKTGIAKYKKITVGHGSPYWGQVSLISLIEEEIDFNEGKIVWATYLWDETCLWKIFKRFIKFFSA